MKGRIKDFLPCYFAFFVSGAMVLMVGAILPSIIKELGIGYAAAGGILTTFAVGNLIASFINPVLKKLLGHKACVISLTSLIPIAWLLVTLTHSLPLLYLLFFLIGIGRGTISIINNKMVNDKSAGRADALNFLHMSFAVGAFIAPFATQLLTNTELGWRLAVYIIIACMILVIFAFISMDGYDSKQDSKTSETATKDLAADSEPEKKEPFYRSAIFYCIGLLLFFYLGLENCVNGWFVTYFKSMGIMSDNYASGLVSVTWVMVMIGRFATAKISQIIDKSKIEFIYCVATAVFFILMILTKNLTLITISIAGLGLFFAGIYPTGIAIAGKVLKGSNTGMSILLAMSALGGIITPQVVGIVADGMGMIGAVLLLTINIIGMFVTSIMAIFLAKKKMA